MKTTQFKWRRRTVRQMWKINLGMANKTATPNAHAPWILRILFMCVCVCLFVWGWYVAEAGSIFFNGFLRFFILYILACQDRMTTSAKKLMNFINFTVCLFLNWNRFWKKNVNFHQSKINGRRYRPPADTSSAGVYFYAMLKKQLFYRCHRCGSHSQAVIFID